jgi:hypothetical protein
VRTPATVDDASAGRKLFPDDDMVSPSSPLLSSTKIKV